MDVAKTSLSAGEIIRALLMEDKEVSKRVKKIFPIVIEKAELPYIVYRRSALNANAQKGAPANNEVTIEVVCYTAKYGDSVELAEAVRGALDLSKGEHNGLTMRACYLIDAEESWVDDAYVQHLVFNVKI